MKMQNKKGVSLIIAIFFVSAFLLVMGGLFEASSRAIESVRNRETEAKLYYLAESASEMASYWAAHNGVGANINGSDAGTVTVYGTFLSPLIQLANDIGVDCDDVSEAPGDQPCVQFEVHGRATGAELVKINGTGTEYFSVPVVGTGDAAAECEDAANANDPCNWNKMYLGDSVEIPLFTETMSASGVPFVERADFSTTGLFKLRVRAPKCEVSGTWCVSGRTVLYPQVTTSDDGPYRNINHDPVLMQWQIADLGGGASLVARDDNISGIRPNPNRVEGATTNTELTGGRINAAADPTVTGLKDFIVLEGTHDGIDSENLEGPIKDFVSVYTTEPVLRLNLVGQSRIGTGGISSGLPEAELNNRNLDVPYLEYQLLTTSPDVSDAKSLVSGFAETSGFRAEFEQYRQRSSNVGGFALESF